MADIDFSTAPLGNDSMTEELRKVRYLLAGGDNLGNDAQIESVRKIRHAIALVAGPNGGIDGGTP